MHAAADIYGDRFRARLGIFQIVMPLTCLLDMTAVFPVWSEPHEQRWSSFPSSRNFHRLPNTR